MNVSFVIRSETTSELQILLVYVVQAMDVFFV